MFGRIEQISITSVRPDVFIHQGFDRARENIISIIDSAGQMTVNILESAERLLSSPSTGRVSQPGARRSNYRVGQLNYVTDIEWAGCECVDDIESAGCGSIDDVESARHRMSTTSSWPGEGLSMISRWPGAIVSTTSSWRGAGLSTTSSRACHTHLVHISNYDSHRFLPQWSQFGITMIIAL